ncbi:MAG: carbamoyl-phosphate synthase large subunit [Lactobacillaceae bacterium]|jgi:carbamoyl-phosphate synthase large subunit|nr:carbamoyl-phosphate synthase large subunit [Lactobacillaceae bacterium]
MTERILIIGGSANDFGRETESDLASYQMVSMLRKRNHEVVIVDDNPYSFTIERTDVTSITASLDTQTLLKIIQEHKITAIIASVGGLTAIRLSTEIVEMLGENAPKVLGLPLAVMQAAQNAKVLKERLELLGEPGVKTRLASDISEAFDAVREFDFPVVVRPVSPMGETLRLQVDDAEQLEEAVETALKRSMTHHVNVDQSIAGYREVAVVGMRDAKDNCIQVGGVEDLDPVGLHSADSIAITPMQTLSDPVVQQLRQSTFNIMRGFGLTGLMEVRFAVQPTTEAYVVTRVTPYFDRTSGLIMVATGYPVIPVMTGLLLGESLDTIKIPSIYAANTAMLEPTMDHIVMRFPVFNFGELESNWIVAEHRIDTVQKSVGATIGVGRSVEEALEKAIRAAHFSNRSFSPTVMNSLSDDDIIEQVIHPRENRILVLIEALRRGYTVDELAELTKINAFYFYKLRRIMTLEKKVAESSWDAQILHEAKYYGLSDGLIAKLWGEKYQDVRRYRWDNNILPTFKAFEPSAGEFEESVSQYYSTFEQENESTRLSTESALVIGTGAFRLGDGAAASYTMASVASELRRLKIPTIIINNNPNDLLFIPQIAEKHYYEPLEMSDVMNVIEIEQPAHIFVPGNRIKLIKSLRELGVNVHVIAKEKYLPSSLSDDGKINVFNYFYDGTDMHLIGVTSQDNAGLSIDKHTIPDAGLAKMAAPLMESKTPGMYQLLIAAGAQTDTVTAAATIRPMPFTTVAFLAKTTGVNWWRLMVRYMLHQESKADRKMLLDWTSYQWTMDTAELKYVDPDYAEHLHISTTVDNGRFAMGATMQQID